jgi:hypothetical protein
MAKPYANEIAKLSETLAWVSQVDISALQQAVATAGIGPLLTVGSGGSLSAAHALAFVHQRATGQLAAVMTPLEAASEPFDQNIAAWLVSAGGRNVDILAAFRALAVRECRQLAILSGRTTSPLAKLAHVHRFVDFLAYEPPAGKDGFLATNSLLAFVALAIRAYAEVFSKTQQPWAEVYNYVAPLTERGGPAQKAWAESTHTIWERSTTVVLHGATTRLGAVDLESKFTEAAIGNLQFADWRNFAHGRHLWLAKRGKTSAVLALVSREDSALAERTLALIPRDIPIARLLFEGSATAASLGSLVAALCIAEWAGAARGIDPGRPGVPDFGRRLYNLVTPRPRGNVLHVMNERDVAAITRKAGVSIQALEACGQLEWWRSALVTFKRRIGEAVYAGVALDYDGTITDTRRRFSKPDRCMADQLVRLIRLGLCVGIATGRGRSVRRDLQAVLPLELWSEVLVGYYNGAEIAPLNDDEMPTRNGPLSSPLAELSGALRSQPELTEVAEQSDRPYQITLGARHPLPENRLWDLAHQVILSAGVHDVTVTRSSHSIDIVPKGVSKRRVLDRMREITGSGVVLAIGDRGRWPGNDYDLLRGPYSLSVDEVSVDLASCWNLGSPGQRGVEIALEYLKRFEGDPGDVRFALPDIS